jgi:hypothetical protein
MFRGSARLAAPGPGIDDALRDRRVTERYPVEEAQHADDLVQRSPGDGSRGAHESGARQSGAERTRGRTALRRRMGTDTISVPTGAWYPRLIQDRIDKCATMGSQC